MKKYLLLLLLPILGYGQKFPGAGVYEFKESGKTHRVLIDNSYLVETVFVEEPAEFILTRGGNYSSTPDGISVNFEFNSNFENDKLESKRYIDYANWQKESDANEMLENKWLMGGRMREESIARRDTSGSRKTMKVLNNGYFQWIAYDTNGFRFSGTGGGTYKANEGKYEETIEYFSRDNSRVGAVLSFDFELINGEWHHKGLSSKGDPIHEVWVKR